jgi:phage terminase large subunit
MFEQTTAIRKIAKLTKRIRAVQGGTAAGKTLGIILLLIDQAQRDETPTLTSIISESFPHLKRGAMRDFLNILKTHNYYDDKRWNKSDYVYTFESGSKIEFFSADQPSKVRGPRRDGLFINEVNNVPLETFEQLEVRTNDSIYLDWNPVSEFWFYEIQNQRDDIEHIILTYQDNEVLPSSIKQSIEARKHRKGWWQVYGLGQLGEIEGKIYTDWKIIDEVPHEARLERYGLDFGYSGSPSGIVAVYFHNGGYILDEIMYRKGLGNRQLADILLTHPRALVVADCAEPKSIDEIYGYGIDIIPSRKGKDSVRFGIQLLQDQRISMTKRSVNLIKEYRNYMWMVDKNGKILNEPEKEFSHLMDAIRYAIVSLVEPIAKGREEIQSIAYEPISEYEGTLSEYFHKPIVKPEELASW